MPIDFDIITSFIIVMHSVWFTVSLTTLEYIKKNTALTQCVNVGTCLLLCFIHYEVNEFHFVFYCPLYHELHQKLISCWFDVAEWCWQTNVFLFLFQGIRSCRIFRESLGWENKKYIKWDIKSVDLLLYSLLINVNLQWIVTSSTGSECFKLIWFFGVFYNPE